MTFTPYTAKQGDQTLEITQESHDGAWVYGVHRVNGKTLGARWYKLHEVERINE